MKIVKIETKARVGPLRVAAYCRVSTLAEIQEESYEIQSEHYKELIEKNPAWKLVKIYADKKSGTSTHDRPGFLEMIEDAEQKKIDLILVKSISRFSRNIVDCQRYIQRLTSLGCCVYFEKEGIRSDDPSCCLVLSLLSAVAQEESHMISKNIRMGYQSRYRRGEYPFGNNQVLGYKAVDGKPVPNEDAWIIRQIYNRFVSGQSFRQISDELEEMGVKTPRGNTRFSGSTIKNILTNEIYVGDRQLYKSQPKNYLTKQPDLNCEYISRYLMDDHEAIIDREIWDKAQAMLQKRARKKKNRGTNKAVELK